MFVEILLLGVALLLFIYFKRKQNHAGSAVKSSKKNIPGMKPSHPEEGNNEDIKKAGNMSKFLKQLHQKYGKIASFWEGTRFAISFASPEFLKHQRHLCTIPYSTFNKDFEMFWSKDVLTFQNGEEARRRRKLYDQFYMQKACKNYSDCFVQVAREFMQKWKTGQVLELENVMSEVAITALARTSFGNYFNDEKHLKHFQLLNDYVTKHLDPPPEPGTALHDKITSYIDEIKSIVKQLIDKRKTEKNNEEYLFVDVLLQDDFTDAQRLADSMAFIGAGHYTTSSLMTWTIYKLSQHPEVQEKIYEELVDVLGESSATIQTVPKLVYLRKVLDECLRMFPGAQFTVRETDEALELDGYYIPKGTFMYQAYAIIFSDPSIYPNPESFDPDRFSPVNSKTRSLYAFKPFGFSGKRQCPGQVYAYVEATVCMSEWCRNFRFHLQKPDQTVTPSDTILVAPLEKIWIRLEPRK